MKHIFDYRLLLYFVGGCLSTATDLLLLYVFTEFLGIHYLISQIVAFFVAFIFAFFYHKYVTFTQREGSLVHQSVLFFLFQSVGICLSLVLLWLFVDVFGRYYMYVAVVLKGLIFFWNYVMNSLFNFRS